MIIDCFPFFNELELLEIRLNELNDIVDKFVISESPVTFANNPKPFVFEENKEMFSKFEDKIVNVKIKLDDLPNKINSGFLQESQRWKNEHLQRDILLDGINACNPTDNDYIILSDIDEIPNKKFIHNAIEKLETLNNKDIIYFFGKNLNYYVDNIHKYNLGGKICGHCRMLCIFKYETIKKYKSLTEIRSLCNKCKREESSWDYEAGDNKNALWHFSNLGGFNRMFNKRKNYCEVRDLCHIEDIKYENIEPNIDFIGSSSGIPNLELPNYLIENKQKFNHLFSPTQESVIVTALNSNCNGKYVNSVIHQIKSFLKLNVFNHIEKYIIYDLGLNDEDLTILRNFVKIYPQITIQQFPEKYKFLLKNPKYFQWKPYCIYSLMNQYKKILWIDSGVMPISNRIYEIFDVILERDEIFLIQDKALTKDWCHPECIEHLNITQEELDNLNLTAGILGINTFGKYKSLINQWTELSFNDKLFCYPHFNKDVDLQKFNFKGHRHDQTVLEVLSTRFKCPRLKLADDKIYIWGKNDIDILMENKNNNDFMFYVHRGYEHTDFIDGVINWI